MLRLFGLWMYSSLYRISYHCGYIPICVAFPIIASSLLGTHVNIPDQIILESFVDYLVQYERQTLKKAFQAAAVCSNQFSQRLSSELLSLMS